jgi:hypothetical protein
VTGDGREVVETLRRLAEYYRRRADIYAPGVYARRHDEALADVVEGVIQRHTPYVFDQDGGPMDWQRAEVEPWLAVARVVLAGPVGRAVEHSIEDPFTGEITVRAVLGE